MLIDASLFLIQTFFNLYLYVIVLRLLLQAIRVYFENPLVQFASKLTQPIVAPLQKVLPEYKGIDLAVLFFALVVEMLNFFLSALLETKAIPHLGYLLMMSMADLLRHFINFYFYAIFLRIILSFATLIRFNPIVFAITQLTEPLLRPVRRVVPLIGGMFDLSPVIVLILLQLAEGLLVRSLII